MDGMGMLLKSMGLDPDDIKKKVTDAQATFTNMMKHFDSRLVTLATQNELIYKQNAEIIGLLKKGQQENGSDATQAIVRRPEHLT